MVDDKTAQLQSEINRLSAKLNAETSTSTMTAGTAYDYWERGKQKVRSCRRNR